MIFIKEQTCIPSPNTKHVYSFFCKAERLKDMSILLFGLLAVQVQTRETENRDHPVVGEQWHCVLHIEGSFGSSEVIDSGGLMNAANILVLLANKFG